MDRVLLTNWVRTEDCGANGRIDHKNWENRNQEKDRGLFDRKKREIEKKKPTLNLLKIFTWFEFLSESANIS